VDQVDRQAELRLELRGEGVDFLRLEAHGAIHVVRVAEHEIRDAPLLDECAELLPADVLLRVDERRQRRGDADLVALCETHSLRAVIDAETAHQQRKPRSTRRVAKIIARNRAMDGVIFRVASRALPLKEISPSPDL